MVSVFSLSSLLVLPFLFLMVVLPRWLSLSAGDIGERVRVDWVVRCYLYPQTQRIFHLRMIATAEGRLKMRKRIGSSSVTE
jgi:hypothetical protein